VALQAGLRCPSRHAEPASRSTRGEADHYRRRATLVDEIGLSDDEGQRWFVGASLCRSEWPELIVAQRYKPAGHGFNPGVALVSEMAVLFVGAGRRLLAYQLESTPRRLWEETADLRFWHWAVHDDVVLMSAELELAAWDTQGRKLWTIGVEPPWNYVVRAGRVHLDIMGTVSEFTLAEGPPR